MLKARDSCTCGRAPCTSSARARAPRSPSTRTAACSARRPNGDKQPASTQSERAVQLRRELPADWDNVSVTAWAGLTVAFCRQQGAGVIIRGARNRSELRHEYQLAAMNEAMGITTLLLSAGPGLAAVSSTVLRELST